MQIREVYHSLSLLTTVGPHVLNINYTTIGSQTYYIKIMIIIKE